MPTGLYPGIGQPLYLANSSFPREPVWIGMGEADPVIPDDEVSIPIALNAGLNTEINVIYDSAPTTDAFEILYAIGIDEMAKAYVLDTVAATTDTTYTWTTSNLTQLSGLIWIHNIGTADITAAFCQQKARTTG